MIDKTLERNVVLTQQFLDLWIRFYDMVVAGRRVEEIQTEQETSFLAIKSELARRHKVLETALGLDYNLDANTMNIVGQAISLDSLRSHSDVAMKKMENEWHRAYISINETLGVLQNRREELADKGQFEVLMSNLKGGGTGKTVMTFFVIIGIVVVLIMLKQMGMLDGFVRWYKGLIGMQ
jgi:hypothetical protein